MSQTKRGAKQDTAPKTDEQPQDIAPESLTGKVVQSVGLTVGAIGATIGTAILSLISSMVAVETGFRTIIDGALTLARKSMADGLEPELIQVRVAKLFAVARDAIVASLSVEARGQWDGFLPCANPSPNKADRKEKGLPSKDRLNAREVRVLARRNGVMSREVRNAHDAYEATYNFASKVARIIEALLSVESFAATVEQYQTRLSNEIDYAMSASALFDAAKKATPRKDGVSDETENGATETPDTVDAIIARTVAQLRAINANTVADAILATVAGLATVEAVEQEAA